jgi:2-haloacid dehalogenase
VTGRPAQRPPNPTYDTVVFDVGGVLLDWDPRHLYRKLFDTAGAMETFLTEVCSPDWHRRNDLGPYTRENCRELAARHPDQAEMIMAWAEGTERMVSGPVAGGLELLADLVAADVPCYLLSNMEPETFPRRLERFPFLQLAQGWVVSGFEGVAKPDRRIFEILLERFGLDPARTLFVDDSQTNVAAGADLGIVARLFTTSAELRQHLERAQLLGRGRLAGGPAAP